MEIQWFPTLDHKIVAKIGTEIVLSRRAALPLVGGAFVLPMIAGCSFAGGLGADLPNGGIDVHCHVFNASDLPVGQFVQRVALGDYEDTVTLQGELGPEESFLGSLASFLTELLSRPAITAEQEAALISQGEPIESLTGGRNLDDFETLREILSGSRYGGAAMPLPPGQVPSENVPVVPTSGTFLDQVTRELRSEGLVGPEELFVIDDIARGILKSGGVIGRSVRWALMLLKPRQYIVNRLIEIYGGEFGINLFTPAMVDFSYWLDEFPRSPFSDQVDVMDLIQRRQTNRSMVHGFVPFNPLNEMMAKDAGIQKDQTPMALVERAIMDSGFIGVKLYPPTGFFPIDNEKYELTVPDRFREFKNFRRGLDDALKNLYAWCKKHHVPIMAHATNSNATLDGSGARAHPRLWQQVLNAYPGLKLNLAHFGGFDEIFEKSSDKPNKPWEQVIGEIVKGGEEDMFVDLSYLSEFLDVNLDPAKRMQLIQLTRDYIRIYDPNVDQWLYGSDWIMLGRETGYPDYIKTMSAVLKEFGINRVGEQKFFMGNAVNYLGLHKNEKTRTRLETYYRKHGLDVSRLEIFDRAL